MKKLLLTLSILTATALSAVTGCGQVKQSSSVPSLIYPSSSSIISSQPSSESVVSSDSEAGGC